MSKKKRESKSTLSQKYRGIISNLQQRPPKWKLFAFGAAAAIAIIIVLTIVFWPSNTANTAQNGDTVTVSYIGTAEDGWIFDSAGVRNGSNPKTLTIGKSLSMPPGFAKGIIGMSVNETRSIHLTPDEGYGPLEITQDISLFPADANISIGKYFSVTTPEGLYMETQIIAINGQTVTLQNINQMAGQNVNFEITLIELIKGTPTPTPKPTTTPTTPPTPMSTGNTSS